MYPSMSSVEPFLSMGSFCAHLLSPSALLFVGFLFLGYLLTLLLAVTLSCFPGLWKLCWLNFGRGISCIGSFPSPVLKLGHAVYLAFIELWISCSRAEWQRALTSQWIMYSSFASQNRGWKVLCFLAGLMQQVMETWEVSLFCLSLLCS